MFYLHSIYMPSHKQFKYLHGYILKEICFRMRIKKTNYPKASAEINKAFKDYKEIPNLSKINTYEMEQYLSMIRVLCCRERGWMLCEPSEPDGIEDWDMFRFLQYKLYNKTI